MKHPLKSQEFKQFFSSHKSLKVGDLLFRFKNSDSSRLGFVVSRKYGNSVKRNLFKRRCRMLFFHYLKHKKQTIVIQPLKNNISWNEIQAGFLKINSVFSIA